MTILIIKVVLQINMFSLANNYKGDGAMKFIKLSNNVDGNINYLVLAFLSSILLFFFTIFFPGFIPFKTFDTWKAVGSLNDWLYSGLPFLLWGSLIAILFCVFNRSEERVRQNAGEYFIAGVFASIRAGFLEEVCFRWLIFLAGIGTIKIMNLLFFEWFCGLGITKLITIRIAGPIANFLTLEYLSQILIDPSQWAIAASLLAANAFFRDGHMYQGYFGFINSWFMGMYLFWIMFKFGLPVAIFIHFLYNFLISIIVYVSRVIERSLASD